MNRKSLSRFTESVASTDAAPQCKECGVNRPNSLTAGLCKTCEAKRGTFVSDKHCVSANASER
jgi:hypothetical protein